MVVRVKWTNFIYKTECLFSYNTMYCTFCLEAVNATESHWTCSCHHVFHDSCMGTFSRAYRSHCVKHSLGKPCCGPYKAVDSATVTAPACCCNAHYYYR